VILRESIHRKWLFKLSSICAIIIAVYHFIEASCRINLVSPRRHLVFACICLICAFGFYKRPAFFIYFFPCLLIQQFFSHGQTIITQLLVYNHVDWVGILLLISMTFLQINLINDMKSGKKSEEIL
jgi:hypothetical protein